MNCYAMTDMVIHFTRRRAIPARQRSPRLNASTVSASVCAVEHALQTLIVTLRYIGYRSVVAEYLCDYG